VESNTSSTPWYMESSNTEQPLADKARQQAQQVLDQTQQKVGQVADRARTQVMSQLTSQKERATGGLESVATALRQTGQQLSDQNQGPLGDYAQQAAEAVDQFSRYLRERDVHELIDQAEILARRQPTLFLGGAFALGFLAARFLKSSAPSASWAPSSSRSIGYTTRESWTAPNVTATPMGIEDTGVVATTSAMSIPSMPPGTPSSPPMSGSPSVMATPASASPTTSILTDADDAGLAADADDEADVTTAGSATRDSEVRP
jgi:hypothetical protein